MTNFSSKSKFPIPEGVVEVTDDYQLKLAHYELFHLKPRGTIVFAGDHKEIPFQFFSGESRAEGIYARLDAPLTPAIRRIMEHLKMYPRTECFITVTLLQFKMVFIASRAAFIHGAGHSNTLRFEFPTKILKTHRRKFIRIPFNESFPAELRFQTENGPVVRKLRDLSREGLKLRLEEGDQRYFAPGVRLRQTVLKVLNKEMPVGLTIIAIYPGNLAGVRILAIAEEDKLWIKQCIRILMKQILKLDDPAFDDEIEKNQSPNKK